MLFVVVLLLCSVWPLGVFALNNTSVAWNSAAGPLGGVVTKMLTVNGEPWAALYSGGIFAYRNAGWQQIGIGHGLPENRIFDIVADPVDSAVVYAAQMIGCLAKSTNGGKTWQGLCDAMLEPLGVENFSSETLALDPQDHATFIVAGQGMGRTSLVVQSKDQGATWETLSEFPEDVHFTHLIFHRDALYLGTRSNGVYRSMDRGKSWAQFSKGMKEQGGIRFAVDPTTDDLYVVGGLLQFNERVGGGLYVLGADAWKQVNGPVAVTSIAAGSSGVWIGDENGGVWNNDANDHRGFRVINSNAKLPNQIFELTTAGSTLSVGVRGYGISVSTNKGKSFSARNDGLIASATREVHVNPKKSKELYVVSWDRPGVYYSANSGEDFRLIGKDKYIFSLQPVPGNFNRFYASGAQFFEGSMTSGRENWILRKHPGPERSVVKSIAVHPTNPNYILAGVGAELAETPEGYGAYYSSDRAKSWKRAAGIPNNAVYSILFDHRNPTIVYAAALGLGVYKSTDGGKRFVRIGDDRLRYVYRLAMSGGDSRVLVAGSNLFFAQRSLEDQLSSTTTAGVFQSLDSGRTWANITQGVREYTRSPDGTFDGALYNFGHMPNYEEIVIDPKNPARIMVGHHAESVFLTVDNGQTWRKQGDGMIPGDMHNYAYCVGADPSFQTFYTCTCGRGLFRGVFSKDQKSISWTPTGLVSIAGVAQSVHPVSGPRTAQEARQWILNGLYTHPH